MVGLGVTSFGVSLLVIASLLIQLPSTYFLDSHSRQLWNEQHRVIRWTGAILKNSLGVFLVLLGGILSIPGIPGQGLLTILVGLVLLDFPGKRRLERAILRRPRIQANINLLRQRFGKAPFLLQQDT
jgi:hypothetical protein